MTISNRCLVSPCNQSWNRSEDANFPAYLAAEMPSKCRRHTQDNILTTVILIRIMLMLTVLIATILDNRRFSVVEVNTTCNKTESLDWIVNKQRYR
jgi:hypothetical protein